MNRTAQMLLLFVYFILTSAITHCCTTSDPNCTPMTSHRPINLFLDWDGTIACTDTLALVASIGYTKNPNANLPPWQHFSDAYMADYAAHSAAYVPQKAGRTTVEQELAWLESLIDVERASVERVEAAGIFANVSIADIQAAAVESVTKQEVQLRPGLKELLLAGHGTKGSASIISVNWSKTFVTELLHQTSHRGGYIWPPLKGIYCNDIVCGSSGKLDRYYAKEDRGIWTAGDKSRVLREAIAGLGDEGITVFVGDSLTDLECLLEVDVGICVRDEVMGSEQRSLAEALVRLGVESRWIGEYQESDERGEDSIESTRRTLWWARDFNEVADSALFAATHRD
jgi:2-hydroxy-3-keto-5-methylthiopentenyl-1-phosphate phosphatase